jgi:glycosyltransferase involved in cell wall biosynthesis
MIPPTSQPSGRFQNVSFVIPVKDEQDTLARLVDGILDATRGHVDSVQIICVDDGSIDSSWSVMQELAGRHPGQIQALRLRRNLGKSVALEVGFGFATGDVIFTMDADLQDDPKEIPRFLEALLGGLDLVSGWKRTRRDSRIKTLSSRLFNRTTALITGVPLHDFNCGFKAYRREVVEQLSLYGELHRYIPVLANDAGFRIGEIEVEHHPRLHGVTKYGAERYMRGFLDLITVMVTTRYLQRPGRCLHVELTGFLGYRAFIACGTRRCLAVALPPSVEWTDGVDWLASPAAWLDAGLGDDVTGPEGLQQPAAGKALAI